MIRDWLKAGVFEPGKGFAPTGEGTPQGGVISPLLMNVALHGLEEAAGVRYHTAGVHAGETKPGSPILVRYADDLVVLCHSQERAEQVKVQLAGWQTPRGLAFNEDKTKIVRLSDEFDFLGYNVRRYHQKLLIKPSETALRRIRKRLATEMRALRGSNVMAVLAKLGPIVRGSPGVPSLSHDVAPEAQRRAFATRPGDCGARCRCWSEHRPVRTRHVRNASPSDNQSLIMLLPGQSVGMPDSAWYVPPEKRGWANYFKHAVCKHTLGNLANFAWWRVI